MKNFAVALVVLASLATAANAASPDPSICREYAGLVQQVADAANTMLSNRRNIMDMPTDYYAVTAETFSRAEKAQQSVWAAMSEYRDALDALAAEIRACKPK